MAREILFRGKRTDNGKWIRGDLITTPFIRNTTQQNIVYILDITKAEYDCFEDLTEDNGYFEVDPETVCQYTGLTDGNGMKIFENDICKLIADDDDLYRIQWDEDTARYILSQFGSIMDDFECLIADDIEVIGNIFDNSELMKES